MVSAGEFRNGVTFEMDGQVLQIMEFQHVKPGKGAAFVRTKVRNVISGSVVERKEMQYLYNEGELYHFMDTETFEQIPVSATSLGDDFRFIKEDMTVKVLSYKGSVFGVETPLNVVLEVTETDPGFKGNTATNTFKPAILETGAEVRVPLFIEQGEKIKVDTKTGEYVERAK